MVDVSDVTCPTCLSGRHKGCDCACSICGTRAFRPKVQKVKKAKVLRTEESERAPRSGPDKLATPKAPRKVRDPKNLHPIKGKHGLAGYSQLPEDVQRQVAELLEAGWKLAPISRRLKISRDQVRTIRNRAEGVTHAERKSAA